MLNSFLRNEALVIVGTAHGVFILELLPDGVQKLSDIFVTHGQRPAQRSLSIHKESAIPEIEWQGRPQTRQWRLTPFEIKFQRACAMKSDDCQQELLYCVVVRFLCPS